MLLGVLLTWWMMDTEDGAENKTKGSRVRGWRENTEPESTGLSHDHSSNHRALIRVALQHAGLASPAWLVVMLTDVYCGE